MRVRPLTPKQEAFCRFRALPDDQGNEVPLYRAYQLAYQNRCAKPTAKAASVALMRKDKIRDRIDEIKLQSNKLVLSQTELVGISSKVQRLRRKNRDWERLSSLIEARAAMPSNVPGHDTGLLIKVPRNVGGKTVDVYRLDKATLDALIKLEESAAKELGQFDGGMGLTVNGGQVMIVLPPNNREPLAPGV